VPEHGASTITASARPARSAKTSASRPGSSSLVSTIVAPARAARGDDRLDRGRADALDRTQRVMDRALMHVELDAIPRERGLEYSVALIDDNANRLWQLGSDQEPLRVPSKDELPRYEAAFARFAWSWARARGNSNASGSVPLRTDGSRSERSKSEAASADLPSRISFQPRR